MGKLRHVALYSEDMNATAAFYERAFDLKRVLERDFAITLSDGLVSLAIVDARRHPAGKTGLDHIGFLVDDMEKSSAILAAAGSEHCGHISRARADANIERKYRDPDGLVFDIVTAGHARPVWGIPA